MTPGLGVVEALSISYLVCVLLVMTGLAIKPGLPCAHNLHTAIVVVGVLLLAGLALYSATLIVIGIEGA